MNYIVTVQVFPGVNFFHSDSRVLVKHTDTLEKAGELAITRIVHALQPFSYDLPRNYFKAVDFNAVDLMVGQEVNPDKPGTFFRVRADAHLIRQLVQSFNVVVENAEEDGEKKAEKAVADRLSSAGMLVGPEDFTAVSREDLDFIVEDWTEHRKEETDK